MKAKGEAFIMKNFRQKTIREIKLWAWAAAIGPMTALAFLFLLWFFGFDTQIARLMVLGFTGMVFVAVIWWWWAMHKIATVTEILTTTIDKFEDVKNDIRDIKKDLNSSAE